MTILRSEINSNFYTIVAIDENGLPVEVLPEYVANANVNYANTSGSADEANISYALNASIANVSISGGLNGYILETDGAGNLSWTPQTITPTTNPGGANTNIQFNNNGAFGGSGNLTFDTVSKTLTTDFIEADGSNLSNLPAGNIEGTFANIDISGNINMPTSYLADGLLFPIAGNYVAVTDSTGANGYFVSDTSVNISNDGNSWVFEADGNLTLPTNTASINYANGSPYGGGSSDYGNSNVANYLPTYSGNIGTSLINIGGDTPALTGGNVQITASYSILIDSTQGVAIYAENGYDINIAAIDGGNVQVTTGDFKVTSGNISATGNITTDGVFNGNGSGLTSLPFGNLIVYGRTEALFVSTATGSFDVVGRTGNIHVYL